MKTSEPDRLIERHALAGQCALVDGRCALGHKAVDGNSLAGPDCHGVADGDVFDRQVDFASVADDVGDRGTKLEDATDRRLGTVERVALDALATQGDKDDEGRRHLLAQNDGRQCRDCQGQIGSDPPLKQTFERTVEDPAPPRTAARSAAGTPKVRGKPTNSDR